MDSDINKYVSQVMDHYTKNWGSKFNIKEWDKGPMKELNSKFKVLEYEPTKKRKMWTYATCGMSSPTHKTPIEIHLFSSVQDSNIIELLTAASYYHNVEDNLDLWHTVNFGRPWQKNSKCSYGLISLPYLDGPQLEVLTLTDKKPIHFYWIIPITPEELQYKKKEGVEALESKLEENKFDYLDSDRESVVRWE